jgi:hypothetical protein
MRFAYVMQNCTLAFSLHSPVAQGFSTTIGHPGLFAKQPLYLARIEDLGRVDLVHVDCAACHHVGC